MALDDAFRCLITAAHSLLVPNDVRGDEVTLHSYGKALQSLQQAIYKPSNRSAAEILCAMGILSIVEVSPISFAAFISKSLMSLAQ